jgi:DNA-binding LacI/PurR family transcriptional regulator
LNKRYAEFGITDETARRVLQAATELGYRRNDLARAVVTGKYNTIGFLRRNHVEQTGVMLTGILDEAAQFEHAVKIIHCPGEVIDRQTIQACVQMRLAGLIVMNLPLELQNYLYGEMARYQIPVVILDNTIPDAQGIGIRISGDDREAMHQAVDHLAGLGHRRIAMISHWSGAAQLREQGYRERLAHHGLDAPMPSPLVNYYDDEGAAIATQQLLGTAPRPTAILCISDLMALVVCRTIRLMGLRVPEDVSVVGYDGIAAAARCDPALTTLEQPFEEMGRLSVQYLLNNQIDNPTTGGNDAGSKTQDRVTGQFAMEKLVPARLVVRNSTAPPSVM